MDFLYCIQYFHNKLSTTSTVIYLTGEWNNFD
jgi:hypothetical protein